MAVRRRMYVLLLAAALGIFLVPARARAAEETAILRYLSEAAQEGNIYEVKKDGSGDFTAIQEGVACAESGDTLLIYPGTYKENVVIVDKTVNLIGTDRDACILTANAENYHYIPLTVGAGRVCNMTICATSTSSRKYMTPDVEQFLKGSCDENDLEAIYELQDRYPGYAVHVDQMYSCGRELSVENCRILSNANQCVGVGCWPDFTVTFTDCELYAQGLGGCVYLHNTQCPAEAGMAQFIMKDCELKNYACPYAVSVHSLGTFAPLTLTFQNVRVSAVAYEKKDGYLDSNMNTWYDVDQLQDPEVIDLLGGDVYETPLKGKLVQRYSEKEYRKLKDQLWEQESLLEEWPQLAEGITYLESAHSEEEPLAGERSRHIIEIYNVDQEAAGDGWCGLSGIYLSDASHGNTLPEMNYPKRSEPSDFPDGIQNICE